MLCAGNQTPGRDVLSLNHIRAREGDRKRMYAYTRCLLIDSQTGNPMTLNRERSILGSFMTGEK